MTHINDVNVNRKQSGDKWSQNQTWRTQLRNGKWGLLPGEIKRPPGGWCQRGREPENCSFPIFFFETAVQKIQSNKHRYFFYVFGITFNFFISKQGFQFKLYNWTFFSIGKMLKSRVEIALFWSETNFEFINVSCTLCD